MMDDPVRLRVFTPALLYSVVLRLEIVELWLSNKLHLIRNVSYLRGELAVLSRLHSLHWSRELYYFHTSRFSFFFGLFHIWSQRVEFSISTFSGILLLYLYFFCFVTALITSLQTVGVHQLPCSRCIFSRPSHHMA